MRSSVSIWRFFYRKYKLRYWPTYHLSFSIKADLNNCYWYKSINKTHPEDFPITSFLNLTYISYWKPCGHIIELIYIIKTLTNKLITISISQLYNIISLFTWIENNISQYNKSILWFPQRNTYWPKRK